MIITLPASAKLEVRGATGIGVVCIATDADGTIDQVIVHDVGDEPDDTDVPYADFEAARD